MNQLKYHVYQVPEGWIGLAGSDAGLVRLSFKPTTEEVLEELSLLLDRADSAPGFFPQTQAAIDRYFAGDITALEQIPLDLDSSPTFFAAAWEACRRIPAGETRSYQWLASEAGNPRAARAAGQAMAKNPWPLIIPCHRVVASDGALHGYGAGGVGVKAKLLEMERATLGA